REERPDIDAVYMTALRVYNQLAGSGGGGGWPLSMFLTPEADPFFGGTYFPARDGDRGPRTTGFLTVARKIQEVWSADAARVRDDTKTIARYTKAEMEKRRGVLTVALDESQLVGADQTLAKEVHDRS